MTKQYNFATDWLKFFWNESDKDEKIKFGNFALILAFECNNWITDDVVMPKTYYEFSKKYQTPIHKSREFYLFLQSRDLIIKMDNKCLFNKESIV